MTEKDRKMLDFADSFEKEFVDQGKSRRTIAETLDTGIVLMRRFSLEIT